MPTVNLSESWHGSWLAAEAYRSQLSLYDACVGDLVNAILQSARYAFYTKGRHIGIGPSLEKLISRVTSNKTSAMQGQPFVNLVRDVVDFASLSSSSSTLSGNEKSVSRKRHVADWTKDDVNVSHRPDIVYVNVPRQSTTQSEVSHCERIIK
ncbi:hypothetical protein O6H91_01G110800 [Diphasiastrum complanatum]|uniref:Uncharacterized protein n=2 Tax=Diphasiastrum complanatum TaxID=34168 RepID=A0ACC2EUI3_DIPCM|nr:hypothetical protein O6H91_01G108100 [Diphasiastrum complanatum]KAJ7570230.1 hypothetical protein O6H91_01G110800 [Diphasiastrum complanatum]